MGSRTSVIQAGPNEVDIRLFQPISFHINGARKISSDRIREEKVCITPNLFKVVHVSPSPMKSDIKHSKLCKTV
jgi:hypothetical protein